MEIIKRTSETEKQTVSTKGYNEKMQVSFNNFGHIALRFFDDNFTPQPVKWKSTCKYCQRPIHTYNGAYPTWYHDETDSPMDDTVTTPTHCQSSGNPISKPKTPVKVEKYFIASPASLPTPSF